jgi:hypothetical protein
MKFTKSLVSSVGKSLGAFLFLCYFQGEAQDSLATVTFYRGAKASEPRVSYDIKLNDAVVGRVKRNSVVTLRAKPGENIFKATTTAESWFRVIAKAGQTYYVECGLGAGTAAGKPTFRLASREEAEKEIARINSIPPSKFDDGPQADTIRAINNLFRRKRTGGKARAIVFSVLGMTSLINTVNYQPTTVTIVQSNGSQTVPVEDSPPAINYVFIGFSAVMVGTGISQANYFSKTHLESLLKAYENGEHLPAKVKGKLKPKDFK